MKNIEQQLEDLYAFIADENSLNTSVSLVNVGWHIEHTLLVIIKIIESVTKSDPSKYIWKFNLTRAIVFTLKKFPRGKGVAPEIVKPKQIEKTDYDLLFAQARE
jgi:hypothetical protein